MAVSGAQKNKDVTLCLNFASLRDPRLRLGWRQTSTGARGDAGLGECLFCLTREGHEFERAAS